MSTLEQYYQFLEAKMKLVDNAGFEPKKLNRNLKDFQSYLVKLALEKGKFALFEDCGLGKTFQQLEWANQVANHTGKPVLVLAPLGVTGQTIQEGAKWGIEVEKIQQGKLTDRPVFITNYEQLKNIEHIADQFSGVVLDESSILKNFDGKTKKQIVSTFRSTEYKLPCTATPAPNDPMELGNHAEFLNVMGRNEMLATYFIHDGGNTSKWRLKKHGRKDFYRWMCTWSAMIEKPSDIGFDDTGYILPPLEITEDVIEMPVPDGRLANDSAVDATSHKRELRKTMNERLNRAAQFAHKHQGEQKLIWVELNPESEMMKKLIPGAVEVKGNDKPEYKEEMLLAFGRGEIETLITKLDIAQFGLNYQNCGLQIFPSPDFSYEGVYQGIRRSLRFGRIGVVRAHFIVTDTMLNIRHVLRQKELADKEMKREVRSIYKETIAA